MHLKCLYKIVCSNIIPKRYTIDMYGYAANLCTPVDILKNYKILSCIFPQEDDRSNINKYSLLSLFAFIKVGISRNAVAFRPVQKKLIKRYRSRRNATSVYYADRTSPTFRLSVSQP